MQIQTGGVPTASFQYDAFNRRAGRTVGGVGTNFLNDGWQTVQELSGTTPTANLLTGLNVDELFRRTEGSSVNDYLVDALGGTVALTDESGAIQTRYSYELYGSSTVTGVASGNAFQYTGRDNDGTGLYYYRNRYYSPQLSRFVSEDPIGLYGGLNLYAYVRNNPINFTDPLGLYTAVIHVDGIIPHSAMFIGGDGRTPFLYDPAGSYQPTNGEPRGSGDFFEGSAANISDYINYHTGNGDTVRIYPIPTTLDQEREIIERAINQGGASPGFCAGAVSGALGGVCGVESSGWPGSLYDNARNAQCK